MGFYTYSVNNTGGTNMRDDFVTWLNEHGVTCSFSGTSVLDITDFNGMSGSFSFAGLASSTKYNHQIVLVTTPGKELIAVHSKNTSSYTGTSNAYISVLIINNGGTLFVSSKWSSLYAMPNAGMIQLGAASIPIEFNSTADNYLVPLMVFDNPNKYVFDKYFISINAVEVAPGVIISDGTKQFISCGLFLFEEYDPATMSA